MKKSLLIIILTLILLSSCGKTGALYLPENAEEQATQKTVEQKANNL